MQFIIDILVAGLMAYLSFTNYLAVGVETLFSTDEAETTESAPLEETAGTVSVEPTPLESIFARIPDILKRSAEYQKATVIDSTTIAAAPTTNPEAAIVNIYCTFVTERTIRTTTGTGFVISEDGIILTNAHVAQFLLLEASGALGESTCTIRTGSPAAPRYVSELLYIPPAWVSEHASLIDATSPSGTGERDYALLHITKSVDDAPLPAKFTALPLYDGQLTKNAIRGEVIAAGYPAVYAAGDTDTNLRTRSATTSVSELFTFGKQDVDVLALRGSSMGQQGSSGGPVVNADGYVIGMIATRGNDEADGPGSLRAITIDHINRTITEETNASLGQHLNGDITARAKIFATTMTPFLTTLLTKEIN
jgi:S1-C subfamily serine protease